MPFHDLSSAVLCIKSNSIHSIKSQGMTVLFQGWNNLKFTGKPSIFAAFHFLFFLQELCLLCLFVVWMQWMNHSNQDNGTFWCTQLQIKKCQNYYCEKWKKVLEKSIQTPSTFSSLHFCQWFKTLWVVFKALLLLSQKHRNLELK